MIVSLAEAKTHLRIDHSIEDSLITFYIQSAEEAARNYLGGEIEGESDSPPAVPNAIKAGILLFVGDLYENRLSMNEKETKVNQTLHNLFYPYRKNLGT